MRNEESKINSLSGKGLYPPKYSWLLLLPFRNLYLSPAKLANRLSLKKDSVVLEMGCGPGYFSPEIARRIPEGKLLVSDIQPEMLEKAKRRIQSKGITNVEYHPASENGLPVKSEFVDIIFLVTVLGEIEKRELFLNEMYRVLKVGGIISISEQRGDPDSLTLEEVKSILAPYGFHIEKSFGNQRTFTANFKKLK